MEKVIRLELGFEYALALHEQLHKLKSEFDPKDEMMPFWPEALVILEYELHKALLQREEALNDRSK